MKAFIVLSLFYSPLVNASELIDFKELWSRVRNDSAEIRATEAEKQVAESASRRSARHWIPGFSLLGRGVHTNDPAQVFFSRLGQRSAEAGDFNPSTLNHPGVTNFVSTSIGMTWSLFEGGGGVAYRDLQHALAEVKSLQKINTEWNAYIDIASGYATILHSEDTLDSVRALRSTVQSLNV